MFSVLTVLHRPIVHCIDKTLGTCNNEIKPHEGHFPLWVSLKRSLVIQKGGDGDGEAQAVVALKLKDGHNVAPAPPQLNKIPL